MTLTGEGPRCQDCMAQINGVKSVEGVVISAGQDAAQQDAAKEAYYATEPKVYCARHPQNETGLRCGRCDTPICPRCMVHAGVGIRCPECAANPQRTIGRQAEIAAAAARGKAPPKESAGRNYWYKNRAYQIIETKHYVIAALGATGIAVVLGVIWGFLLNGDLTQTFRGTRVPTRFFQQLLTTGGTEGWSTLVVTGVDSSIHLIPEVAIGFLIALGIEKITRGRLGPGLQVIAGVAVLLAVIVSIVTVTARLYTSGVGTFPPIDSLVLVSWQAFTTLTSEAGVVIFWIIGIVVAAARLKR